MSICSGSVLLHGYVAPQQLPCTPMHSCERTHACAKRGGDDRGVVRFAKTELLLRCVVAGCPSQQLHHLQQLLDLSAVIRIMRSV